VIPRVMGDSGLGESLSGTRQTRAGLGSAGFVLERWAGLETEPASGTVGLGSLLCCTLERREEQ
jgi:hypothetical protein